MQLRNRWGLGHWGLGNLLLCSILLLGSGCSTLVDVSYPDHEQPKLDFARQRSQNTPVSVLSRMMGSAKSTTVNESGDTLLHYPVSVLVKESKSFLGMKSAPTETWQEHMIIFKIVSGRVAGAALSRNGVQQILWETPKKPRSS